MANLAILRNIRPAPILDHDHRDQPRSTDRGLSLLKVVADDPDGITLSDAARAVELSPSTALRHLRSLEAAGLVQRRLADGCFEPGAELLRIARNLAASASLTQRAQPLLDELAAETGESAYLAEPVDRAWATYTGVAEGSHSIRHVSWLGQRVTRRGSAVGDALAGRIDHDGVALRRDAVEPGVTAISAPVLDRAGRVVAAVSLIGPSFRFTDASLATARHAVRHVALRLS